ncbi:transcription termination factor 1, mitochondrial [Dicentrarchus labrax]|uniref:transcription termination factor 1, mitochondrial n=1 Tax=Dicentrarchus labrax TaxID=13489 RepID=UPI00162F8811|nr:transcription termination factor 1, mitochondrial [Dicentrarchus labrax]
MAVVHGVRALLSLHRSALFQRSFRLIPVQLTSTCLPTRLCSATTKSKKANLEQKKANKSILDNLHLMGVDVEMACQRQPGVFRKNFTNEQGLAQFLQSKGATSEEIASIISRFPRAITRSTEHLEERWELWRKILNNDSEIVSVLERSPEAFFRSSDNKNFENIITFLTSLGFTTKDLERLLLRSPRIFSCSLALIRQKVKFLNDICVELGGTNPEQFTKTVLSRNAFIFSDSIKRIRMNIDFLRTYLKLGNSEMLSFIQGSATRILVLSTEYMQKNLNSVEQMMVSLGCQKADIQKLIHTYPVVLYIRPETLSSKLECLLKVGITLEQILETPKVLDYSTQTILGRLELLQEVGYNFRVNGISVLDNSQKRFLAKIKKIKV